MNREEKGDLTRRSGLGCDATSILWKQTVALNCEAILINVEKSGRTLQYEPEIPVTLVRHNH